jgi:hypothetical protein
VERRRSDDMSDTITDLNKRVIELVDRDDYFNSLSAAEESLELSDTYLGRDTQAFATSLNNLATVHYQSGATPRRSNSMSALSRSKDLSSEILPISLGGSCQRRQH